MPGARRRAFPRERQQVQFQQRHHRDAVAAIAVGDRALGGSSRRTPDRGQDGESHHDDRRPKRDGARRNGNKGIAYIEDGVETRRWTERGPERKQPYRCRK